MIREKRDRQESMDLPAFLEDKVRGEMLAQAAHLVKGEIQELLGYKDSREIKGLMDVLVNEETKGNLARQDLKDLLARQEVSGIKDRQDLLDRLEQMDHPERKEKMEIKGQLVAAAVMAVMAVRVPTVIQESKECQAKWE